ncbi:MAG: integrase family protein [Hyphomicrobium sp.]|nr:integrase family protein [Hyphomicrobium sp.]
MVQPTRLNKKIVEALPAVGPKGKPYLVRDTVVRGLILAVNRQSKTWKVQRDLYRNGKLIKTVRTSIGDWPDMDIESARTKAQEIIALVKRGIDPNAPVVVAPLRDAVPSWTVERLYDEYAADLRKRNARDRTIDEMKWRMNTYLSDWKGRSITSLTRAECRARHDQITAKIAATYKDRAGTKKSYDGKRTANHVMKELKWALNFAATLCEDDEVMPRNPVAAVTMHKQRAANRSLALDDLPEWWCKIQALPNPLRRAMHTLGILSGLRPGALVSIRREWIDLGNQVINIPHTHMKSNEAFALPLSGHMRNVVRTAISIGDLTYADCEWLFPSRSKDGKSVIATQVWKEKSLPSETGHILRHTYRTIAETAGIPPTHRRLLLDHALGGMDKVYVDKTQLFRDLLNSQEVMSDRILELCKTQPNKSAPQKSLASSENKAAFKQGQA